MVERVMSRADLQAVHSRGTGFVYNDNWSKLHQASCPWLDRMEVYTGPGEEFHAPGAKYFDLDRDAIVTWFKTYWWPGHRLTYCATCNP